MSQQVPLDPSARADDPIADAARDDDTLEAAPDLAHRRLAIVNVVFVGRPGAGDRGWVLIDAGVFGTKAFITDAAAKRFGPGAGRGPARRAQVDHPARSEDGSAYRDS